MHGILSGLSDLFSLWHLWIIAAVILGIGELFTPGFFLLSIALGCIFAGIASTFLGLAGQLIALIAGTFSSFFLFKKYFTDKKRIAEVTFGTDALIGKNAKVLEAVSEDSGLVKIGGETWPARALQGSSLDQGESAIIVEIKGNKLIVGNNE